MMANTRVQFWRVLVGAVAGSFVGSAVAASLGQPAGAGLFWATIYLPVEIVIGGVTASITYATFRARAKGAAYLSLILAVTIGSVVYFLAALIPGFLILVWPLGFFTSLAFAILAALLWRQPRDREPRRPSGYREPLDP